jgi:hypothetical protein
MGLLLLLLLLPIDILYLWRLLVVVLLRLMMWHGHDGNIRRSIGVMLLLMTPRASRRHDAKITRRNAQDSLLWSRLQLVHGGGGTLLLLLELQLLSLLLLLL